MPDILKSMDKLHRELIQRELDLLFVNAVCFFIEGGRHRFNSVQSLNDWESFLDEFKSGYDMLQTIREHIDSELDSGVWALVTNAANIVTNFDYHTKTNISTEHLNERFDALIDNMRIYITKKLDDGSKGIKERFHWDIDKPFNIENIYKYVDGARQSQLHDIVESIGNALRDELQLLEGNIGGLAEGPLWDIQRMLVAKIEEIEAGAVRDDVSIDGIRLTFKTILRILMDGAKKQIYINNIGTEEGTCARGKCLNYSLCENMCLNPNLLAKFMALADGLRLNEFVGIDETRLNSYVPAGMCPDSSYNKYYEKIHQLMLDFMTHVPVEKCSEIRGNINGYLFFIIKRLTIETFHDPYSLVDGDANGPPLTLEMARDYIESHDLRRIKYYGRGPFTHIDLINLSKIIKIFGEKDLELFNRASLLYERGRERYMQGFKDEIGSRYDLLEEINRECDAAAGINGPSRNVIYNERHLYMQLSEMLDEMVVKMPEGHGDVTKILGAVLNMEQKYIQYLNQEMTFPGPLNRTDSDTEEYKLYQQLVDNMRKEWHAFLDFSNGPKQSILHRIPETARYDEMIGIIDGMIEGGSPKEILAVFRRLLAIHLFNDEAARRKEIESLQVEITKAHKNMIEKDLETMDGLIRESTLPDAIKKKLIQYLKDDVVIKDNIHKMKFQSLSGNALRGLFGDGGEEGEEGEIIDKYNQTRHEIEQLKLHIERVAGIEEVYEKIKITLDATDETVLESVHNLSNEIKILQIRLEHAQTTHEDLLEMKERATLDYNRLLEERDYIIGTQEKNLGIQDRMYRDQLEIYEELKGRYASLQEEHSKLMAVRGGLERAQIDLGAQIARLTDENLAMNNKIEEFRNIDDQLAENVIGGSQCNEQLEQVAQSMGARHEELRNMELLMQRKKDMEIADLETKIRDSGELVMTLNLKVAGLGEEMEKYKGDVRAIMGRLHAIYSEGDFADNYEKLITDIRTYTEDLEGRLNAEELKNKDVLDLLGRYKITSLQDYLDTIRANQTNLATIYKDIQSKMCSIFKKYKVESEYCAGWGGRLGAADDDDDDDGSKLIGDVSAFNDAMFSALTAAFADKEAALLGLDNSIRERVGTTDELRQLLQEKESDLADLKKSYDEVVDSYAKYESEANAKINKLKGEIKVLSSKNEKIESELEGARRSNEQNRATAEDRETSLEAFRAASANREEVMAKNAVRINDLEMKLFQLRGDLKIAQEGNKILKGENVNMERENKKLRSEQEKTSSLLERKGIEVTTFIGQLRATATERDEIKAGLVSIKELNAELVEQNEKSGKKLADIFAKQLKERNETIEKLSQRISEYEETLHKMKSDYGISFIKLEEELFHYKDVKTNLQTTNSELQLRLSEQESVYDNAREQNKSLNEQIHNIKLINTQLDESNIFLKRTVTNLKEENDLLGENVQKLRRIEQDHEELLRERKALIANLGSLDLVALEHRELLRELDKFSRSISSIGVSIEGGSLDSIKVGKLLKSTEEKIMQLDRRNLEYRSLVADYQKRVEVYKESLENFSISNQNRLGETYSHLEAEYKKEIENLQREVESCHGDLGVCNDNINNILHEAEEAKKRSNDLDRQLTKLRQEYKQFKYLVNSTKSEPVLTKENDIQSNCRELLHGARDERLKFFGDNIDELVAKISKKVEVIMNYRGPERELRAAVDIFKKQPQINLKSELHLPRDCGAATRELIKRLQNINAEYRNLNAYLIDVDDIFSDIANFGTTYVRLKPPQNSSSKYVSTLNPVVTIEEIKDRYKKIKLCVTKQNNKCYLADAIFDEHVTNAQVYETIRPILGGVKKGKNVMIILYGQTGSGKTFTIIGDGKEERGILGPIFAFCKDLDSDVRLKLVGLYRDNIYDLLKIKRGMLDNERAVPPPEAKVTNINEVSEMAGIGFGKLEKVIASRAILRQTNFNDRSSRAHMFIDLYLPTLDASIIVVDLCGNEKTSAIEHDNVHNPTSNVRLESIYINLSLMEIIRDFLLKYRLRQNMTMSKALRQVIKHYARGGNLKINSIFHIYKYYTDVDLINKTILTSTHATLEHANQLSIL